MEIKIVEKPDRDAKGFGSQPLSYRIRMEYYKKVFTLTREYFRFGFNDGEIWDGYFFRGHPIQRVSFMTRKFKDKDYIRKAENQVIKLFYKKALESEEKLKKELIKTTNSINNKINKCNRMYNFLDKFNRPEKIKKLKNLINNK